MLLVMKPMMQVVQMSTDSGVSVVRRRKTTVEKREEGKNSKRNHEPGTVAIEPTQQGWKIS